jgi:hypothetical protein
MGSSSTIRPVISPTIRQESETYRWHWGGCRQKEIVWDVRTKDPVLFRQTLRLIAPAPTVGACISCFVRILLFILCCVTMHGTRTTCRYTLSCSYTQSIRTPRGSRVEVRQSAHCNVRMSVEVVALLKPETDQVTLHSENARAFGPIAGPEHCSRAPLCTASSRGRDDPTSKSLLLLPWP